MTLLKSIGGQIKDLRDKLGLTQNQVAKKIGGQQENVSQIEHGDPKWGGLTIRKLQKIAEALKARLVIRFVPK